MKKSKIYTKTGDAGETGLVSGNRISKADARIDLYGELDELNSRVGFFSAYFDQDGTLKIHNVFLHRIQSALFDLGSNLACEPSNRAQYKLPQITDELITELESQIDVLDSELLPLKNFILPGGSVASASVHLARTNARTVERKLVHFSNETKEELPVNSLVFLNRLSDYFFVLARYVNKVQKTEEIPWKPAK